VSQVPFFTDFSPLTEVTDVADSPGGTTPYTILEQVVGYQTPGPEGTFPNGRMQTAWICTTRLGDILPFQKDDLSVFPDTEPRLIFSHLPRTAVGARALLKSNSCSTGSRGTRKEWFDKIPQRSRKQRGPGR